MGHLPKHRGRQAARVAQGAGVQGVGRALGSKACSRCCTAPPPSAHGRHLQEARAPHVHDGGQSHCDHAAEELDGAAAQAPPKRRLADVCRAAGGAVGERACRGSSGAACTARHLQAAAHQPTSQRHLALQVAVGPQADCGDGRAGPGPGAALLLAGRSSGRGPQALVRTAAQRKGGGEHPAPSTCRPFSNKQAAHTGWLRSTR